jgi:hypothetical protein
MADVYNCVYEGCTKKYKSKGALMGHIALEHTDGTVGDTTSSTITQPIISAPTQRPNYMHQIMENMRMQVEFEQMRQTLRDLKTPPAPSEPPKAFPDDFDKFTKLLDFMDKLQDRLPAEGEGNPHMAQMWTALADNLPKMAEAVIKWASGQKSSSSNPHKQEGSQEIIEAQTTALMDDPYAPEIFIPPALSKEALKAQVDAEEIKKEEEEHDSTRSQTTLSEPITEPGEADSPSSSDKQEFNNTEWPDKPTTTG